MQTSARAFNGHCRRWAQSPVKQRTARPRSPRSASPQPWDLVLMDINMPTLDGYTVTERIRADRRNPNCNVIVVAYTAEPGNVARSLARRAGMDEFVSKSASMVELIGVLH